MIKKEIFDKLIEAAADVELLDTVQNLEIEREKAVGELAEETKKYEETKAAIEAQIAKQVELSEYYFKLSSADKIPDQKPKEPQLKDWKEIQSLVDSL